MTTQELIEVCKKHVEVTFGFGYSVIDTEYQRGKLVVTFQKTKYYYFTKIAEVTVKKDGEIIKSFQM